MAKNENNKTPRAKKRSQKKRDRMVFDYNSPLENSRITDYFMENSGITETNPQAVIGKVFGIPFFYTVNDEVDELVGLDELFASIGQLAYEEKAFIEFLPQASQECGEAKFKTITKDEWNEKFELKEYKSADKIAELIKLIDDGLDYEDEKDAANVDSFTFKTLNLVGTDPKAFSDASASVRAKIAVALSLLSPKLSVSILQSSTWEYIVSTLSKLDPDTFSILCPTTKAKDALYSSKKEREAAALKKIGELSEEECDIGIILYMVKELYSLDNKGLAKLMKDIQKSLENKA